MPTEPNPSAGNRDRTNAYNIVFILTDQERQFRAGELPPDLSLPAHARLRRRGTTFVNYTIKSLSDLAGTLCGCVAASCSAGKLISKRVPLPISDDTDNCSLWHR